MVRNASAVSQGRINSEADFFFSSQEDKDVEFVNYCSRQRRVIRNCDYFGTLPVCEYRIGCVFVHLPPLFHFYSLFSIKPT